MRRKGLVRSRQHQPAPREGGNNFSGTFFVTGMTSSMQGDNYTPGSAGGRGLRVPNSIK